MCFTASRLRSFKSWNWEGDRIIPDPVVLAARSVPDTNRRYNIDIREYLVSDANAVVKDEIGRMVSKLSPEYQHWFRSRRPGSFDYRAAVITEHVSGTIKYWDANKRRLDAWQFPDETLCIRRGDCEDIAFLLASLLLASGVSGYVVRVALGVLRDKNRNDEHAHAWVMYKNERGAWILLDPLLHTVEGKEALARTSGRVRGEMSRQFEYVPYFLFNDKHLWSTKQEERNLPRYLKGRKFWREFNPKFAASVHDNIFHDSLYKSGKLSWLQYLEVMAISISVDADIATYHPFDHFDNGYIKEGWDRVRRRLSTGRLNDLALACHGIGDFYAHSSYAHFGRRAPDHSLIPYDAAAPSAFPSVYDSGNFDFHRFSSNTAHCSDRDKVMTSLKGQIISGRYAQPDETYRRADDWTGDKLEMLTNYPADLESSKQFAERACLPHHEEIAVDSTDMKASHVLYRSTKAPDDSSLFVEQFNLRREAAIKTIDALCADWTELGDLNFRLA